MAITSVGYGGSVDELGWANLTAQFGAEYSVVGNNDFRVTGAATPARSVAVAPGAAYGNGVYDVSDQVEVLTAAPLGSGTRWDTVVLRRDWQGPGGSTSLVLIPGGSSRAIATQRQNNPGTLCDQPLALVQFSASASVPQTIVDLRVWSGSGGLVGRTAEARQYLTRPGTSININGTNWVREFNSSGNATWTDMGAQFVTQTQGTVAPYNTNNWSRNLVWIKTGNLINFRARPLRQGSTLSGNTETRLYTLPPDLRPSVIHRTVGVRTLSSGRTLYYPIYFYTDGRVTTWSSTHSRDGNPIGNGAVIYFDTSYRR